MTGFDMVLDEHEAGRDGSGDLVSVAVTVSDCIDDLPDCLESLAGQSHSRLELIVVDDSSAADKLATACDWLHRGGRRFERRRLLRLRGGQGPSDGRNLAFSVAQSDLVFVLDADGRLLPRALARLHETMVDTGAAVTYAHVVGLGASQGLNAAADWALAAVVTENRVGEMALVDRRAWARVGGYSSLDCGWEHHDLWCKFMEAELNGVLAPELLCGSLGRAASRRLALAQEDRRRLVHRMLSAHPWLELRV